MNLVNKASLPPPPFFLELGAVERGTSSVAVQHQMSSALRLAGRPARVNPRLGRPNVERAASRVALCSNAALSRFRVHFNAPYNLTAVNFATSKTRTIKSAMSPR
jgi:hypothetical protein